VKNALTNWSTALRGAILPGIASAGVAVILAVVNPANAASISFSAADGTRSGTPVNVDVFAQDVEDGVEVTLKVNDSNNIGDLLAVYFNFGGTFNHKTISKTSVTGQDVTKVAFDTNNIVAGNIGQKFEMAVQFGTTGSAGGLLTSTTFKIAQAGLSVQQFLNQTFAVRLQSVGSGPNGGGGSAKQYGIAPTAFDPEKPPEVVPPTGTAVPEPMTILGSLAALGVGYSAKRKQSKQNEAQA
jgi:hypothetical protein